MGRKMGCLKGQITKAETKSRLVEVFNLYQIKHLLESLEIDFVEFRNAIFDSDITSDNERTIMDEFSEYEEKYFFAKALFTERMDHLLKDQNSESPDENKITDKTIAGLFERQNDIIERFSMLQNRSQREEVQMPKIKIPIFSGNYFEWTQFRELFDSIVDSNAHLSDIEKFYYLTSSLKGEAAALIKHYALIAENYASAWSALTERYDKPYMITSSIINKILQSEKIKPCHSNMRSVSDLFNESINSLDNLGSYAKSRYPWVIRLLLDKLDNATAERWATSCSDESSPSLKPFLSFLEDKCNAYDIHSGLSVEKSVKKP